MLDIYILDGCILFDIIKFNLWLPPKEGLGRATSSATKTYFDFILGYLILFYFIYCCSQGRAPGGILGDKGGLYFILLYCIVFYFSYSWLLPRKGSWQPPGQQKHAFICLFVLFCLILFIFICMIAPRGRLPVACWATSASFYIILYYIIVFYCIVFCCILFNVISFHIYFIAPKGRVPAASSATRTCIYFIYLNLFECI
jgi:hypothetical protein